ncbi:MAG TPA: hypothetical protein VKG78_12165 [Opitutaceae bacterium]|nr:hypothetical protein [Opitutaceae bacterium]
MKRLVTLSLAAALLANSACHMFSKKKNPAAPKESPSMATDVEKDFMHRWIEKRTGELISLGKSPADARAQATDEFKTKFSYTDAARQAK